MPPLTVVRLLGRRDPSENLWTRARRLRASIDEQIDPACYSGHVHHLDPHMIGEKGTRGAGGKCGYQPLRCPVFRAHNLGRGVMEEPPPPITDQPALPLKEGPPPATNQPPSPTNQPPPIPPIITQPPPPPPTGAHGIDRSGALLGFLYPLGL